MQTTILTTFAVESKKERAAQVGVFVNFCRQVYGFVRLPKPPFDRRPVPLTVRLAWTFLLPGYVCRLRAGRSCWCDGSDCGRERNDSYHRGPVRGYEGASALKDAMSGK